MGSPYLHCAVSLLVVSQTLAKGMDEIITYGSRNVAEESLEACGIYIFIKTCEKGVDWKLLGCPVQNLETAENGHVRNIVMSTDAHNNCSAIGAIAS
ncbi:hypothetical protein K1719_028371 [Acacia pycnantha]|nr:hypothetical protein K1719_028371 [Acacia pycnantha]